jgi:hypothetical protein
MNNLIQAITAYTTALEQKLSALETRVALLETESGKLKTKNEALEAQIATLQAEVAALEATGVAVTPAEEPEVEIELIVEDPQEQETPEELVEEPQEESAEESQEEPAQEMPLEPLESLEIIEEEEPVVEPVAELIVEPAPQPEVKAEPVAAPQPAPRPVPQQTSLFGAAVEDIRQAISLGDRFLFQRELFAGNGELMQKTLDEINSLNSLSEAMDYVLDNFEWDKESTAVQLFENVLKRRFA